MLLIVIIVISAGKSVASIMSAILVAIKVLIVVVLFECQHLIKRL